jgi:hypothetical protein
MKVEVQVPWSLGCGGPDRGDEGTGRRMLRADQEALCEGRFVLMRTEASDTVRRDQRRLLR